MASKLAKVKEIILELLSDENEYTTDDIHKIIMNCGLELDSKSSVVRTAIYQLRSSGIDIYSRDRGIYQLKKKRGEENNPALKDFVTIFPSHKTSPKCVYVHSNGKITMSGRLNAEIKTRRIEIRISSDIKKIALIPNGDHSHIFTKAGGTKNDELVKKLKNRHYTLPVTFIKEQDGESGIWIGEIVKNFKTTK